MHPPHRPHEEDGPAAGRRFLLILGAILLLAYAAYSIVEARRGNWAHFVSLTLAVVVCLGLPFLQRRLEAAFPDVEFPALAKHRPVRDALWGFLVFFLIMGAFILING